MTPWLVAPSPAYHVAVCDKIDASLDVFRRHHPDAPMEVVAPYSFFTLFKMRYGEDSELSVVMLQARLQVDAARSRIQEGFHAEEEEKAPIET
ncbi:MAG: hypothetical protein KJ052_21340 [Candidatus Hydrogenedentes bacterium]|nr:hypothetical protein [Candidatus Hydrogenedentota bacterium]